jgi:cytochrome c
MTGFAGMNADRKTGTAASLSLLAIGVWMELSGSAHAAAGDVAAGKAAFAKCASCHQIGPSARAGFGPQLNGIVGRPAATTKDYRYSTAMQNSRIVWTEDKLRAFMKSPGDVVPGTKMRFWGISNAQDLDNLLAYMKTFP